MVNQGGQWPQGGMSAQQQFYQQQPGNSAQGQQQPRGPGGQYAPMVSQPQVGGGPGNQSQQWHQYSRNAQSVSPAMQQQFNQVGIFSVVF